MPIRVNLYLKHALIGEPLPVRSQTMQDLIDHCGLLGASLQPRDAYQQGAGQEASRLSDLEIALIRQRQFEPKIYQDHCNGCHIRY